MGRGDVFMISREHRYGLQSESYSAVNGYVRKGETPQIAAIRILKEDFGIIPGKLENMGMYRIQVNRGICCDVRISSPL